MALYSKYRPQNFANLVGQDHIRLTLLHEIQSGTLTHAYLFAGPRGTGKTSSARLIAKALNCTNKNAEGEPCDQCDFCKTITEGSLIDVLEIDAASNRGIEEIRDLKEKINFAPTRAKTKVYIIDEVHMLTKEAFNALLKTLEEPPENVYFILCTTEIHKIPETIISRCQRFDFKRIDIKTIMTRLNYIAQMEKIEAEDAAIELIARHVEGGLRDAIGLMEQMVMGGKLLASHVRDHMGITGHQTITTLLDLLEKKELTKAIHLINEVHNEGYDLSSFTREVLECLRDKLITAVQQGQDSVNFILEMIFKFEEARDMLRNTVIPQLPLEIAAIKICGQAGVTEPVQRVEKKIEKKPEIRPVEKAEQKRTDEESATAKALRQEYEMEKYKGGDITKHWARVLDHVQPPSLRRSIGDAKMVEMNDTEIKLVFRAKFHMERTNTVEGRSKTEKAVQEIFGKTIKITCELEQTKTETQAIEQETAAVTLPIERKAKPKLSADDLAKKAMEIFGED
ncbi:MAG: DNA polymerase III subunit gamma/tau [Patescibacteria group bacterium]